jgi:hypothetical protein
MPVIEPLSTTTKELGQFLLWTNYTTIPFDRVPTNQKVASSSLAGRTIKINNLQDFKKIHNSKR